MIWQMAPGENEEVNCLKFVLRFYRNPQKIYSLLEENTLLLIIISSSSRWWYLEVQHEICCINRFTSLCKNVFNLLEFLAEAF